MDIWLESTVEIQEIIELQVEYQECGSHRLAAKLRGNSLDLRNCLRRALDQVDEEIKAEEARVNPNVPE